MAFLLTISIYTIEARIKELRFFLGRLVRFWSNGLVFSSPTCKVLNKVLIYISVCWGGGADMMQGCAYDPREQDALTIFMDLIIVSDARGECKIFSLFLAKYYKNN